MTRMIWISLAAAFLLMAGCNGGDANGSNETATADAATATVAAEAGQKAVPNFSSVPAKSGGPFSLQYSIIGTPIVGSPVAIDLQVHSALGAVPAEISYQVNDPSAMTLHEAQPERLLAEFATSERFISERVTVIPQREGRLYLNVSVSSEIDDGTVSTVISIPIHVGEVPMERVEQGVVETDEEGEAVRVLTPD